MSRAVFTSGRVIPGCVVLGFLMVAAALAGQCSANQVPPPLTSEEQKLLASPPLPYSVAVFPWDSASGDHGIENPISYASDAELGLAASGAFKSVVLDATRTAATDLSATSTGWYCGTAILPIATIITFGLWPTIFSESNCFSATLRSGGRTALADSVVIRASFKGRAIMGWLAVPMGFMPGWSHQDVAQSKEFRNQVRLSVIRNRDAIAALVGPTQ